MKSDLIEYVHELHTVCKKGIGQTAFRAAIKSIERDLSRIEPERVRLQAVKKLVDIKMHGEAQFDGKVRPVVFDDAAISKLADYLEKNAK